MYCCEGEHGLNDTQQPLPFKVHSGLCHCKLCDCARKNAPGARIRGCSMRGCCEAAQAVSVRLLVRASCVAASQLPY